MTTATTGMEIVELRPNLYQLKAVRPGSHVYVIKGTSKNVLIDTSMAAFFPYLKTSLQRLGLRPKDIHFIILTHEHFDHIGATMLFYDTAVVAAHRLAANKIELQDEFVTMIKTCTASCRPFRADLWLEDGSIIDLGDYKLNVVHTPGHTSGCICLYEPRERILFSGDTVFGGGTLSQIASSGSISDYMNSLQRLASLRVKEMYPAHGRLSEDPEGDIQRGLQQAYDLFDDTKALFDALSHGRGGKGRVLQTMGKLYFSK